jgi:FixJ family two-component response regulator
MNVNVDDARSQEPSQGTVYVIDQDRGFLRSMNRLLRASGHAVRTFTSTAEFLAFDISTPSCLLMNPDSPGMSGLELHDRLAASGKVLNIVFLGGHARTQASVRAARSDTLDIVAWPFAEPELLAAVTRALERDRSLGRQRALREDALHRLARLTPRERVVCDRIAAGLQDDQIAAELGRTRSTIQRHHVRIDRKLAVESVAQLVRLVSLARPS